MSTKKCIFPFLLFFVACFPSYTQGVTSFVNPMIGTAQNGHVFPGATVPFGMVQLSPDQRTTGWAFCSGYNHSENRILGFSHTHLSGTGVGDLGDILLMPYIGKKPDTTAYPGVTTFTHSAERSSPGYYQVFLPQPNINVELTASVHTGVHQYTFPQSKESFIGINLQHKVNTGWGRTVESEFAVVNDSVFSGYKIIADGWAPLRKIYFVIMVSKPAQSVYINSKGWSRLNGGFVKGMQKVRSNNVLGNDILVNLNYHTAANEKILVKVAISAVSVKNAFQNLKEVENNTFDGVVAAAKEQWNSYLGRIQVDAAPAVKELFYTGLYRTMVQPNQMADTDSSYVGPDYNVHKSKTGSFYSTFSLWDTYRAAHPLYTLLTPELVPGMVNSMLDHFDQNGYLPIWTLWGTENHCMIGNHSVPVIADAILKGFAGIDEQKAFAAIKSSLTEEHQDAYWKTWQYDRYGYIRADSCGEASVSKTLEYAFDDWCAAQVARKLGREEDYTYFLKRSRYYKNVFYAEKGFMWPRNSDGRWASWNEYKVDYRAPYTEGNAWQYIWSVQHDPYGLISLFKSPAAAVAKLDSTFTDTTALVGHVSDVTGLIGQYAHGNEPSHHTAYYYAFMGQDWKTQKYVRQILSTMYAPRPDGLSGNDDCGQMSAWYVFSALGFYPFNPASGVYVLGSPAVTRAQLQVGNDKYFTVIAKNNSEKNIYVASVKLNGKPYSKNYIRHTDIVNGGTLEFFMTSKPVMKVTAMGNRPPVE